MVLITYFLMNDNHAADAWAFAGILIRQAYALGLHRDPSIIVPHAHPFEKQQRRKVWQAVLFQDTFLTVILKLPPTANHTDVRVEDLALEVEESLTESGATGKRLFCVMFALFTPLLESRQTCLRNRKCLCRPNMSFWLKIRLQREALNLETV